MPTELEALRTFRDAVGDILRDNGIAPLADIKAAEQTSWAYDRPVTIPAASVALSSPSTSLIVSFKHYEHQGIDLKLVSTVGGGFLLQVERTDNGSVLMKVELPKATALLDRRA